MFNNLTIKTRLILIIAFSAALATTLAALGLVGMQKSNAGLQTVYIDRTIPLADLAEIKSKQIDIRLKIATSLASPNEMAENIEHITKTRDAITKIWDAYLLTYLTPDEKILADKFVEARKNYVSEALNPILELLKAGDTQAAQTLTVEKLRPLFIPVSEGIDALVRLQQDVAKQEYEAAQSRYQMLLAVAIAVGVLGLARLPHFHWR